MRVLLPPTDSRPAFSIHLDAIRALAALTVFAGHGRDLFLESVRAAVVGTTQAAGAASQTAGQHTTIGHQAVIIFFVLSGYLVGGGVLRAKQAGSWSWRSYLTNRLTRLWMPLLPALLIGCLLDRVGLAWFGAGSIYDGPPGQYVVGPGMADRTTWSVLLGNAFFLQNIAVPVFGSNAPLWSLANEFWYYIAFPFLYLLVQRGVSPASRLGALLVLAAIGLFVGAEISLYFVIWLMGVALAAIPRLPWPSAASRAVAPVTLLFLAANGLLLKYPLSLQQSDLVTGLACALLYARAAHRLSEMSYTLYLAHAPVLTLLCASVMTPWRRWPLDLLHAGLLSVVLAATFIYCCIVWYCFERHTMDVRRIVSGWIAGPGKPGAGLQPQQALGQGIGKVEHEARRRAGSPLVALASGERVNAKQL
jgi:peptidoglycan/LPS O-acetylase OafA/YrhL